MKHCHATGCQLKVLTSKLFCRSHWFALPKELRDRVWATYVPGQEKTKQPSREYVAAVRAAQDYLRDQVGKEVIR